MEAYRYMLLSMTNMIRLWPLLVSRGFRGIAFLLNLRLRPRNGYLLND
jgi:hypothetical protein